jgi:hypothetical protein
MLNADVPIRGCPAASTTVGVSATLDEYGHAVAGRDARASVTISRFVSRAS